MGMKAVFTLGWRASGKHANGSPQNQERTSHEYHDHALAQGMPGNAVQDVGILNVALGLEQEAINVGGLPTAEQRLDE